jgi:hypothetical protein
MSRSVRHYLFAGFGFFLLLEAMLVAAILYWPNFRDNVDAVKALAPTQFLRELVDGMGKEGALAYVNAQHFFKGCNTMGIAASVLFAINVVAGEVHRGTLEILLARPLSRNRILLEKWFCGLAAVILPVFLTTLTVPWLLSLVDETAPLNLMLLCALHQSLFLALIYTITFLLSCLLSKPVNIAFGMLFLTTFEFAIYLVKDLTHWSIFRVVDIDDYAAIVHTGRLPLTYTVCMSLGILLLLGGSLIAFRRRIP